MFRDLLWAAISLWQIGRTSYGIINIINAVVTVGIKHRRFLCNNFRTKGRKRTPKKIQTRACTEIGSRNLQATGYTSPIIRPVQPRRRPMQMQRRIGAKYVIQATGNGHVDPRYGASSSTGGVGRAGLVNFWPWCLFGASGSADCACRSN